MKRDLKDLKVAIVQDYLHVFGGAEGVANAIYEIFPQADIYTATYDRKKMEKARVFKNANVIYPKWKDSIPGKFRSTIHKILIANLPLYFYMLDLSAYDLIISSTAHFAKGVRTRNDQLHISYIHTPPRFLYGYPGEIRKRSVWYWRLVLSPLDILLRFIDKKFAKHPDFLVCNSREVQGRIKKFYNREAVVINPFPNTGVSSEDFKKAKRVKGKYYLSIGRLQAYKNVDLIIEVCGKNGIPLKVAGTGDQEAKLEKLAKKYKTVDMLGFVSDKEKKHLLQNCIAFIGAVEYEDFGMTPLEAMLYGKPAIVYKQGGYLETVEDGVTGIFFDRLNERSLLGALDRAQNMNWNPDVIRQHALRFSKDRFKSEFKAFVIEKINKKFL